MTSPSMPIDLQIRDIFLDTIKDRFLRDPSNIILTVDMGALSFRELRSCYPERFINVGVCEQNSISLAAGLACAGMKPIVYGITPFLVSRAKAQLRHDISIGNKKIMIIGSGIGLSYSEDGPSHHSFDDVSMVLNLPNFSIATPITQDSVSHILEFFDSYPSYSLYARLDKCLSLDNLILSSGRTYTYSHGCIVLKSTEPTSMACLTATPFMLDSLLTKYHDHDIIIPYLISPSYYSYQADLLHSYDQIKVEDESSSFGGLYMYISTILSLFYPGCPVSLTSPVNIDHWLQNKFNRSQSYLHYMTS